MYDIGIIGGAGPMAGALVFEQIIKTCQVKYSCYRDFDFPSIQLISYPFSEMLNGEINHQKISQELTMVAKQLNAKYFSIACNTLHAFIDSDFPIDKCIHMLKIIKSWIGPNPLVICTQTSKTKKIHQNYFNCCYPDDQTQKQLDTIIDQILNGTISSRLSDELANILISYMQKHPQEISEIVLGCTEFSVLHDKFPLKALKVIDPIQIAVLELCENVFKLKSKQI